MNELAGRSASPAESSERDQRDLHPGLRRGGHRPRSAAYPDAILWLSCHRSTSPLPSMGPMRRAGSSRGCWRFPEPSARAARERRRGRTCWTRCARRGPSGGGSHGTNPTHEHVLCKGCVPADVDADERTRTSTELPPHGPEPDTGVKDVSSSVQNVQVASFPGRIGRIWSSGCCHGVATGALRVARRVGWTTTVEDATLLV